MALLTFGLIAPFSASAQYGQYSTPAPAGYQPASAVAPSNLSGTPATAAPSTAPAAPAAPSAPASASTEAAHKHRNGKLCPACAAKMNASMPPGEIVRCEHMKKGVCPSCQAALAAPGTFVTAPTAAPSAPGRAVVSSGSPADAGMGEPAPVGVMRAGFSQANGPAGMQSAVPSNAPGHAVAESAAGSSTPGRALYQKKSDGFPHPHIIRHLLGLSGNRAERREEAAFKKSQAHAMESYDSNAPAGVSELPASTVFGKNR